MLVIEEMVAFLLGTDPAFGINVEFDANLLFLIVSDLILNPPIDMGGPRHGLIDLAFEI